MKPNKLFTILLLLFGEALIIIGFLYFAKNLELKILILNIAVTSILYFVCFVYFSDKIIPIVDIKEKSHSSVGSLGIKWVFVTIYAILAIGAMLILNTVKPLGFTGQIIIQGVILFILLLGIYFSIYASNKVHEVYTEEKQNRSRIGDMKKATNDVKLRIDQMKGMPADLIVRITTLLDNMRFISPGDNNDAIVLETDYLKEIKTVHDCLFEIPINYEKITENISNCERVYNERKKVYSN